ncbi:mechanosensitive ion channel family protein [Thermoproteota archaeon]
MGVFNLTENSTLLQYMGTLDTYIPNRWLQALILLILVYAISKVVVWVMKHTVRTITRKTRTKIDDEILDKTKGPIAWLLITIGARLALIPLELESASVGFVSHLLNTASIIIIALVLARVTSTLIDNWGNRWARKTKSSIDDALIPIFHKFSKVVFVLLTIFFVFSEWNIDITGILAGVGIAGLALGFAVKDSLSNIFGGISLILDKAVQVGDYIEVNGTSGEVVDVGLRSTRIRTWDNELLIMPNGTLANSEFKNWKLPNLKARIIVDFGVEYGTKHEKVRKIVHEVIKKHKNILKDPKPIVRFREMGDSALTFGAYVWVNDIAEKWATKEKIVSDIYDALNKAKIGIPYPQMDVHVKKK